MAWRRGSARESVTRSAERRLASVARQWRPTPASPEARADVGWGGIDWTGLDWEESDDADPSSPAPSRRIALGPWTASAVRGLALLIAVAVVVAGYWAWSGRPRAVADVPEVIATGAPVGVPGSTSPLADEPAADPAGPDAAEPNASAADPAAAPGASVPDPAAVVVVHVAGLVATPGLVELPSGSRVADAIDAAGGVTRRRATDSVNLARVLVDGEQILVGAAAPPNAGSAAAPGGGTAIGPLNLNAATASELEGLPGIGPVIAGRIVAWRSANGPFRSVDELGEVAGIGEAVLGQVRPLVRV